MGNTSIKISKLLVSEVGKSNYRDIAPITREATAKLEGSAADKTKYKNIIGGSLAESKMVGDKTLMLQLADFTPELTALFCGGTYASDTNGETYLAPANENVNIELSFQLLTEGGLFFDCPRVSVDCYPAVSDDDLHYYAVEGSLLTPENGDPIYQYKALTDTALTQKAITSFKVIGNTGQTITGTITEGAGTIAVTVPTATDITALVPMIVVSPGATYDNFGAQDFTTTVAYVVTSPDGKSSKTYTVTITKV